MAHAAIVGTASQSLASACSDVLARARSSAVPDVPTLARQEGLFLSRVAHLDISGAKEAWAALGRHGPQTLATGLHERHGIFSTWLLAANSGADWGIGDDVVVDMLLWLDDIGACPLGDPPQSKTTHERLEGLAAGGSERRAVREACIPYWAFACEKPHEMTPVVLRALASLGKRWLSDPEEEARVPASAWIQPAFFSMDGLPRQSCFLNLLAEMWPSFGFSPSPEHWLMIADGWSISEDPASGYRPVKAVGKLLDIGSDLLPPSAADRLAFMAARLGYASLLGKIALRCEEFPMASHESPSPPDRSAPKNDAPSAPAPLILVAAMAPFLLRWEKREEFAPSLGHCFEALSRVPEAVQAALAGGPRPDLLASADPRLFAELHSRFPEWFEPNGQGENVMHLLASGAGFGASDARLLIGSCAGIDALAEMLGARASDGSTPLSRLLDKARAACSPELVEELEALSEAAELRRATRPAHGQPAAASAPTPRL